MVEHSGSLHPEAEDLPLVSQTYKKIHTISRGAFAQLYLTQHRETQELFAMKVVSCRHWALTPAAKKLHDVSTRIPASL